MSQKIEVLIVDDSSIMRLLISDILKKDQEISVIGTANNGKNAIEKTKKLKPDVILMDINMGEYSGPYAIEKIMKEIPTPIIVLSAIGNQNLLEVFEATRLGAFDYINKPTSNSIDFKDISSELTQKIKAAAKANVNTLGRTDIKQVSEPHTFAEKLKHEVIVIGASTGGPVAVEKILMNLPENLAVPVLIAQHMPNKFIESFASRLNRLTTLNVHVGAEGTLLQPKHVYIAPGQDNMIVKDVKGEVEIGFTNKKYKEFNNPSVNALMESTAAVFKERAIGVLLTGMGKDGGNGMKAIKAAGGLTIAQNEKSSVVFGMPQEAIRQGAIDHVIHINQIGFFLINCLG